MLSETEPGPSRPLLRFAWLLLGIVVATYSWLNYWAYSAQYRAHPSEWTEFLAGRASAPAQYRIGVMFSANALSSLSHGHLALRYSLTLLDAVFLVAGLLAISHLLVTSPYFRRSTEPARAAILFLGLLLVVFYLTWTTFWYPKPETLANFCCIALAGLVLARTPPIPTFLSCFSLVGIAACLGTTRADSGLALMAGIIIVSALSGASLRPLARSVYLVAGVVGLFVVLGVEFYIKHVMYPNNPFSDPLFQLGRNVKSPVDLFCVAASLAPYFLTVFLARRHWSRLAFWEKTLIISSLVEFTIFFIVAIADEVRLFLPYSMALIPTSVTLLCHTLFGESSTPAGPRELSPELSSAS